MIDIENLDSAWKGHRNFAEWLVNEIKPEVIVDLGVDYGYSTFCLANQKIGTVYGIDNFEGDIHTGFHSDAESVVEKVIQFNGYDNVVIIKNDFNEEVKNWDKSIDILHVDGLHTYESTKENLEKWSNFLHENSIIIMHDTTSFEGVFRAFSEFDMPKMNFTHSHGLGILSKNKKLMESIANKFDLQYC